MRVTKYVYNGTNEFSFNALCIYTLLFIILFFGCTTTTIEKVKDSDPVGLLNKGIAAYENDQYDQAIAYFNEAIEIDPGFAEAFYNRGKSFIKKRQDDQAISDCNKAIELNPNLAEAYRIRGHAYMYKKEYDNAIANFDRFIALNPMHAEAYHMRGAAHAGKGDLVKAISDLTKTIELNPKHKYAYGNRAVVYDFDGQHLKACSDWQKRCELFGLCENYELAKRKYGCEAEDVYSESNNSVEGKELVSLQDFMDAGWEVSKPMTVEEIEEKDLKHMLEYIKKCDPASNVPKVPFGYANEDWQRFKTYIRNGDEIIFLSSPGECWEKLAGWQGYAIFRDGKIVNRFATIIN